MAHRRTCTVAASSTWLSLVIGPDLFGKCSVKSVHVRGMGRRNGNYEWEESTCMGYARRVQMQKYQSQVMRRRETPSCQ